MMNAKKKKVLFILGGVAAVLVLAVIIFALSFDINSYKPRIEASASQATGLDVRINGKMGLSLFPFGVSAGDVRVAKKGMELVSIEKLRVGVELTPLLNKQIKVTVCELVKPAFTIAQDANGKYNFEGAENKSAKDKTRTGAAFSLNELRLSNASLVHFDAKTGKMKEFKDFDMELKGITIDDISADIITNISFTGSLDVREVLQKNFKIKNLKAKMKAGKGIYSLDPITMDVFGAKAEGNAVVDKSKGDAVYKINFRIPKLDFANLEESLGTKKVLSGKGDLDASLTIKEKGNRKLISGMDGTFSLRGDNLVIYTMDLDKVLTSYGKSQDFNLVDLGAYFVAGPLSTVALKGYRYGDVYNQTRGGQGSISRLVSRWKVSGGMADAVDCALSTRHNRVAVKGRLNLVAERYDNVTAALLDEKGCAKVKQGISGPFGSPKVGVVSVAETLAGPVITLFRKAKGVVKGGKCEVFYNGAVQQPR
jgi:uncharacterized protein involved in outer membrane biogenesis